MNIPTTCPYCGAGASGPQPAAALSGHRIVFVRAIPCPSYVPDAIRMDYKEACLFRDLSPRISATLSCRCLREMIRDGLGVQKPGLSEAIAEAQSKLPHQTQWAIKQVCGAENVKARTDKDVNLILDVEKDVAEKLVWLVERLLQDWYVKRNEPGSSA